MPLSISKIWIYNIFPVIQLPFILYLFYQARLKFLWATEDFLYLFMKFKTKTLWSWIKRNIIILSKSDDNYCLKLSPELTSLSSIIFLHRRSQIVRNMDNTHNCNWRTIYNHNIKQIKILDVSTVIYLPKWSSHFLKCYI